MAYLLKPAEFEKLKSPSDVLKLMKQDIRNNAGKDVYFVAVKNVKVGSATTSVFVVTDNAKPWIELMKAKKPALLVSGKCKIIRGPKIQVAIKSVSGGSREAAAKLATLAIKDKAYEAVDFEQLASDKSTIVPKPKVTEMVQRSYDQAQKEGTLDRGFDLDAATIQQMSKLTTEIPEYGKFAAAFEALATKYHFANYKKVPVDIWSDLIQGLIKGGYFKDDIPKAADQRSFILAYKGPQGKVIREKTLAQAMAGLEKFTAHAAAYLDKVVAEVLRGGGAATWSFWSGIGAKDAAIKYNPGGVVLEGSVGAWFDKVSDFKPLTGVQNMALWTALSELYASKAAEYYDKFKFRGYVGPGATRDQTVFNQIEQPTFIQVLNTRRNVDKPDVDWYVVDCEQGADGKWKPTANAPAQFSSRAAALADVAKRYQG